MRDTGLIDKVKKASVMTAHGYKKAVGWSEKTIEWGKTYGGKYGGEAYGYVKEGLQPEKEQEPKKWDLRNADYAVLNYSVESLKKKKELYKKKEQEILKELNREAKDYKLLQAQIRQKYDLRNKDVRYLNKHFRQNRDLYGPKSGFYNHQQQDFINLINKQDALMKKQAQARAAKRAAKKKQAAITALQKTSDARKDLQSGSSASSDNLYAASQKSFLGSVHASVKNKVKKKGMELADKLTKGFASKLLNPFEQLKQYIIRLLVSVISQILAYILPFLIVLVIVAAIAACVTNLVKSILSFFGLGGDDDDNSNSARESATYSEEKIDELVAEREGLTDDQEKLIRYALKQVGKEYTTVDEVNDGMSRTGPDSYDCSGLAYDVEKYIGKDITASTAAGQAEMLMNQGKYLQDTSVAPQVGDLIYYADPPDEVRDKNKDKWNYVYHVAIYVGNGYVVEAFDNDEGVIYGPLRSKNAFAICTP